MEGEFKEAVFLRDLEMLLVGVQEGGEMNHHLADVLLCRCDDEELRATILENGNVLETVESLLEHAASGAMDTDVACTVLSILRKLTSASGFKPEKIGSSLNHIQLVESSAFLRENVRAIVGNFNLLAMLKTLSLLCLNKRGAALEISASLSLSSIELLTRLVHGYLDLQKKSRRQPELHTATLSNDNQQDERLHLLSIAHQTAQSGVSFLQQCQSFDGQSHFSLKLFAFRALELHLAVLESDQQEFTETLEKTISDLILQKCGGVEAVTACLDQWTCDSKRGTKVGKEARMRLLKHWSKVFFVLANCSKTSGHRVFKRLAQENWDSCLNEVLIPFFLFQSILVPTESNMHHTEKNWEHEPSTKRTIDDGIQTLRALKHSVPLRPAMSVSRPAIARNKGSPPRRSSRFKDVDGTRAIQDDRISSLRDISNLTPLKCKCEKLSSKLFHFFFALLEEELERRQFKSFSEAARDPLVRLIVFIEKNSPFVEEYASESAAQYVSSLICGIRSEGGSVGSEAEFFENLQCRGTSGGLIY